VPDALVDLGSALVAADHVGGGAGQGDQERQLAAAARAVLGLELVVLGQLVLVLALAAHCSSSDGCGLAGRKSNPPAAPASG
jgi:hypothetical protein